MNKSRRFKSKRRRKERKLAIVIDKVANLLTGWIKVMARGESFARKIMGMPQAKDGRMAKIKKSDFGLERSPDV